MSGKKVKTMRTFLPGTAAIVFLNFLMPSPAPANQGFGPVRDFHTQAPVDKRIDKRMVLAAFIARLKSPHEWTTLKCWHAVKSAMVEAGAIPSMPASIYARDAGDELVAKYGFVRLNIHDPYLARPGPCWFMATEKRRNAMWNCEPQTGLPAIIPPGGGANTI